MVGAAIAWTLTLNAQRVGGPLPGSALNPTTAQAVEIRDDDGRVPGRGDCRRPDTHRESR